MGQLGKRWRDNFQLPLIAVTGSNGKTTVKEMLASILGREAPVLATSGNLNNDIGVPLTLFSLAQQHRYAVIEMGANNPGEIAWLSHLSSPTVALITQCAPAHLQGFVSVDGVARAKAEIFRGLIKDGIAIINSDDAYAPLWREQAGAYSQISFGMSRDADVFTTDIDADKTTGKHRFNVITPAGEMNITLALPGKHNVMNALAAIACCVALDIPSTSIRAGLEKVQPVAGRLQMKRGINGSRLYDDTYNANPASLKAALTVLGEHPGRRWLVLGDMGELGESAGLLHEQAGEAARLSGR